MPHAQVSNSTLWSEGVAGFTDVTSAEHTFVILSCVLNFLPHTGFLNWVGITRRMFCCILPIFRKRKTEIKRKKTWN